MLSLFQEFCPQIQETDLSRALRAIMPLTVTHTKNLPHDKRPGLTFRRCFASQTLLSTPHIHQLHCLNYDTRGNLNSTSLPSRKENQRTLLRALHYITCRTFYKFSEMHTSEHSWPHSFLLSILNFLFLSQYLERQSLVVGKTAGDRTLHLSRQLEGFACRQNSWTIHPSTTPAPVRDTSELQSQLETQAPSGNQKSRRGKATGKCVI